MLMNKLALAGDYMTNRGAIEEEIRYLHDTMPGGVVFDSIKVEDDGSVLSLTLSSYDVKRLIGYMTKLEQEVEGGKYGQVSLDNIGRSRDGAYTMTGTYYLAAR
jgi:hypothetical protein